MISSGDYAETNPFRFSTKYLDGETGLYYYGYRYYSPRLGRWINRDPIAERGGLHLYVSFSNRPISSIDPLGQSDSALPPKEPNPGCCCCCPTGLDWEKRLPNPGSLGGESDWGHKLKVTFSGNYHKTSGSEKPGNCHIEWWEWSNIAAEGAPGAKANTWQEWFGKDSPLRSGKNRHRPEVWRKYWGDFEAQKLPNMTCPGENSVAKVDTPSLPAGPASLYKGQTRDLYFVIKIRKAPNCKCDGDGVLTIRLHQRLTLGLEGSGEGDPILEPIESEDLPGGLPADTN